MCSGTYSSAKEWCRGIFSQLSLSASGAVSEK
jgi:hypothetical protein